MNKTITKSQYYTLIGLREVAKEQCLILDKIEKLAKEITGEQDKDFGGHASDYIYGTRNLDEMLKILGIKVKNLDKQSLKL